MHSISLGTSALVLTTSNWPCKSGSFTVESKATCRELDLMHLDQLAGQIKKLERWAITVANSTNRSWTGSTTAYSASQTTGAPPSAAQIDCQMTLTCSLTPTYNLISWDTKSPDEGQHAQGSVPWQHLSLCCWASWCIHLHHQSFPQPEHCAQLLQDHRDSSFDQKTP